jgi:hypothetical protein
VDNNKKAIVVGAAIAAVVVLGGLIVLLGPRNFLGQPVVSKDNAKLSNGTNAAAADSSEPIPPRMVLAILDGNEDHSEGIAQYEANNTDRITLAAGQHIRFESPDYRTPDAMKVISLSPKGTIQTLLKSYDVNNEFFVKLEKGNYELIVQARWIEQTYVYHFYITIS